MLRAMVCGVGLGCLVAILLSQGAVWFGRTIADARLPMILAPHRAAGTVECLETSQGKTICFRLTTTPDGVSQIEPYDPCVGPSKQVQFSSHAAGLLGAITHRHLALDRTDTLRP